MIRPTRSVVFLLLVALVATSAGCGANDGASPSASTSTSTPVGSTWCAKLAASNGDGPIDAALVDVVPAEHGDAAAALVGYSKIFAHMSPDATKGPTPADTQQAAAALNKKADVLESFATAIDTTCHDTKSMQAVRQASTVAALSTPKAIPAYCSALNSSLGLGALTGGSSGPPPHLDESAEAELADLAPQAHRDALGLLAAMSGPTKEPNAQDVRLLTASLIGIGLYLDAKCEVPGSFAAMAVLSAFVNIGGDSDRNAGDIGTEPPSSDVAAPTARLPAGSTMTFEATTIDLDEDGHRKVSMPKPVGWESDDFMGIKLSPPSGSTLSTFTELHLDTSCDGMCEVTDWAARVRGKNGILRSYAQNHHLSEERKPAGSDGVVVTSTSEDRGPGALVLRWDDTVDHYLRCEVRLDERDAAYLDAFVAACEAARPNWFKVT